MTIKTNFFDGGVSYGASDLIAPWGSLLTNGVYNVGSGALNVLAHSPANLSVDVQPGACNVNGYYVKCDAVVNVSIGSNVSGYNRIDNIVVKVDTTSKASTIVAIQGTPSSSPVAPVLGANQFLLAQVLVGNNVSVLNQNVITDARVNVDIFGNALASKANVAQENWIPATLLNGWTADGTSGTTTAMYMKDTLGFVHMAGIIKKTSGISAGEVIFTLPVNYRPGYTKSFLVYNSGNVVRVDIQGNGNIVVQNSVGPLSFVSLDIPPFMAGA